MFTELEFKYPSNIIFLILTVIAVIFFFLAFRKKEKIMTALHLGYKTRFKILRTIMLAIALCLMILALLGPQIFSGYAEINKTGMDIYVLMDTSKSMLVADISPDRITVAKKIVASLIEQLDGDRIGFIPFASDAYIQMPLTDDYQLALMFLDVIDTNMISGGGSNLAAAINLANGSFTRASGADKVILIISDGEENDGISAEALKNITDDQVKIFTVGIGTDKGGLVPVYNDSGDSIVDYMKDSDGNHVTSRLHSDTLRQLARDGHGSYYQTTEVTSLLNDLSNLEKDTYATQQTKRFNQLFQYFLAPSILLFIVVWFIPERRIAA